MSGFLSVTQFIEQQLAQAPAVAGEVVRSKGNLVELDRDTAVRVYPTNADGQAAAIRGGWHSFLFDVTVDCYARAPLEGANAGDAEAAADAVLTAVWQRIAGATPPAGVANLLSRPRVAWEFTAGDRQLACARLTFAVDLSTANQTLALWSL
jgi:hypothetical protein